MRLRCSRPAQGQGFCSVVTKPEIFIHEQPPGAADLLQLGTGFLLERTSSISAGLNSRSLPAKSGDSSRFGGRQPADRHVR